MPESGALRVALEGPLVDQKTYTDSLEFFLDPDLPRETLVFDLVQAIEMAARDDRINSMTLVLDRFQGTGISKIEEVGTAIDQFRSTGKQVIAISDSYTREQYLLASHADRILMHPMGIVELTGYSSYRTYMADALESLKVDVHVFRTGPHKNAIEPLIATEMSEETRKQSQRLIDDIWDQYQASLLTRRNIDDQQLHEYTQQADELLQNGLSLGELALQTNLVDALVTRDQVMAELQAVAGATEEGDFYRHTNALGYLRANRDLLEADSPRVGYLAAVGEILNGIQPSGTIGGDSLVHLLRQARINDDLKALVLRVDSPGGSAFASEVVRRELQLYREEGIPVVVSMGSLAASGGYWMSTPASEIWATPTTLTGSIGAFSVIPIIDRSLNALGLNSDGVSTGPLAAAFRLDRPLSDQAKTIFQSQINRLYADFLSIVASGRGISMDHLESVAGGRVWTGRQALEFGLVDKLGTQLDAIAAAAELAGLEPDSYQVHQIEPQLSFGEQLIKEFMEQVSVNTIQEISSWPVWGQPLAEFMKGEDALMKMLLSDPQHQYLHCSSCPIGI